MILELADGTQLNIKNIFAGPKLIDGVMRDTFRIEVDPEVINFDDLKKIFSDTSRTLTMSTYNDDVKTCIGEGYSLFVSLSDTKRKVSPPPGKLVPDSYEEIYIVTMAQLTYQEYQNITSSSSK